MEDRETARKTVSFPLPAIPCPLVLTMQFKNDTEMFNKMTEKLYSSVISDILDGLGIRQHTLSRQIRPLYDGIVLTGRAMPILMADVFEIYPEPYKLMIEAMDSLKEGQIALVCANGSTRAALWGELFSTATRARGARGVIIDGLCRDVRVIREMRFPVFAIGVSPLDSMGRSVAIAYNCPVESGDATIHPGDILFADPDGIVVIPRAVEKEVITRAFEKVEKENLVREELQRGMLLGEAWRKYKVL
ncbi:MAG TPA: RraA family protein [Candidatus Limnocylindrales bacterium]|nr:RraA family protein [Candidatus Limnocylindrales bacterium]